MSRQLVDLPDPPKDLPSRRSFARARERVGIGDVSPAEAAARLNLSLDAFREHLPALLARGFPPADETTGQYDLTAIDRWRMDRHLRLFPELTSSTQAEDSSLTFGENMKKWRANNAGKKRENPVSY
jgi:hypothetical protein